ncbi:MAG: hypothetical protein ALAOOOJD_00608 [bacterium]|nr:hypothetical protein [bacterium]
MKFRMTRKTHQIVRAVLGVGALSLVLLTATISFTDDSVSLRTNFFSDSGGLLVQSPTLQFIKEIARNKVLSLQYSLDRVNIPPFRGISAKPLPLDGVSGASKPVNTTNPNATYTKNRNELIATLNATQWNATVYYSAENDYTGRLLGFGFNQEYNQKNTTLAAGLSYGYDTISPVGKKATYTHTNVIATAAITQTLSPTAIMRFGVDVARHGGYQSNPYRTVNVAGQYYLEQHPQQRTRVAGYVKLNKHLHPANAALWMEYRLYNDDWGVLSHTLAFQFYQNLSKRLHVRYRYRYYTQNNAYFWKKDYSLLQRLPKYFTDDYKLEPFNSHLYGFHLAYRLEGLRKKSSLLEHSTVDMKYERFFTSNNFTANVIQIGLTFEY